ncbi:MAG: hypothetical protein QOI63_310 [Thermoplasmata archaeon]|nr:hypothetical protein [Thermoplasmata archaeon]
MERAQSAAWQDPTTWVRVAAVAVAYYGLARVGLLFALPGSVASPIWPPTGLAIAAVALWRWPAAAGVLLGAVAAESVASGNLGAALGMGLGNTLEALVGGLLLARIGGPAAFRSVGGVGRFIGLAALAPLASVGIGVGALVATGTLPAAAAPQSAWTWYLGDMAGTVVVAPVILLAAQERWRPSLRQAAEPALAGAILLTLAALLFGLLPGVPGNWPGRLLLLMPPLAWVATRLSPAFAAACLAAIDALAIVATKLGRGPFQVSEPNAAFLQLQSFILTAAAVVLTLGAFRAERRRDAADLEGLVANRTGELRDEVEDRKRAEAAARESLERFRVLAEGSPLGIFHTTLQGQVDYANPRWMQIAGCDFHDFAAIRAAVHPEDRDRLTLAWRAAVAGGTDLVAEFRYVHADGTTVLCATRASPVRDAMGQATGFVGTVDDITERRALEAREREMDVLREQARFKTEFLRTAAHELGNPLTPIKIQLHLLKEVVRRPEHAGARRGIDILDRNVARLHLLVRDMLESARLQAGRLSLAPRPMDLSDLVHEVAETFQEAAIQDGVALEVEAPPRFPLVADPDRLTQVLDNLVSNAMKFTPAGGRVHVSVQEEGALARITVQDSGAGFTADQAGGLFQPFGQVHDAVPGKGGTGLGLYISKGIVEQHGGELTARSDGPGTGATFTVRVPVVAALASAQPQHAQVEPQRSP